MPRNSNLRKLNFSVLQQSLPESEKILSPKSFKSIQETESKHQKSRDKTENSKKDLNKDLINIQTED